VPDLPTGTVSLLFTDIEGSTRLQHRLGVRYQEVVTEHRRLLENAFGAHGGTVVDRQTESFFVAFSRARHAVQAAAEAQRAIADHAWPDGAQVKVRMGIHAGEPELAGDRYVGLAVSRAARICGTGHGGQVLLSESARGLLVEHVPDGVRLLDLGIYALKDFDRPEPITQLVVEGLPARFPPLRTGAGRRSRLRVGLASAVALLLVAALAVVVLTRGSEDLTMGETSVGVLDPDSGELVSDIPVGFKSSLIAAGEGFVWVADPVGSTLVKIDPETREIVARFGIASGATPFGLAVDYGAVWLAVERGERYEVLELGLEFGDLRRRISYGQDADPSPLIGQRLTVGAGNVWVVDPSVGGLWRIDPRSAKATRLTDGLFISSLTVDADAVWVGGPIGVTRIDADTGDAIAEVPLTVTGSGETSSLALGVGALWYATSSDETLFDLDRETGATANTVSVGQGPTGIAITGDDVWVVSSRDGSASRVDPEGRVRVHELGATPGAIVAAFGLLWVTGAEPRR
jgi:class 3 adenylate cyclase/DNA-binding beta-propeller fold protein YncE